MWLWFSEYLKNRLPYVSNISGESSPLLPVLSGVPQGSILGPILFLVYVNDLPNNILQSSAYLFTDDTKFIRSITNFNDTVLLQSDIDSLSSWCKKSNLSLNQGKCAIMRISLKSNTDSPTYIINNSNVPISSNQRDLGIIISHNLSWNAHYSYICANARLGSKSKLRHMQLHKDINS